MRNDAIYLPFSCSLHETNLSFAFSRAPENNLTDFQRQYTGVCSSDAFLDPQVATNHFQFTNFSSVQRIAAGYPQAFDAEQGERFLWGRAGYPDGRTSAISSTLSKHTALQGGRNEYRRGLTNSHFKRTRTARAQISHPQLQAEEGTNEPMKRSQKLGDKVTALQQLVSPFGKTDTASVLQEAHDYIKALHDQIEVLWLPYIKQNGSSTSQVKEDDTALDLESRGLCLFPIAPTIPLVRAAQIPDTPTSRGI